MTDPDVRQQPLVQERYPQPDLFICDVADATLKDIIPQLEHPFYSLSKKPDTKVRRYEHDGNWVEIVPSVKGLATIYDKDILIYAISQVVAGINRGEEVSRRVRINARALMQFTHRGTSGQEYRALCAAIDRLDGTRIRTNVRRGNEEQHRAFGLIESATVARKFGRDRTPALLRSHALRLGLRAYPGRSGPHARSRLLPAAQTSRAARLRASTQALRGPTQLAGEGRHAAREEWITRQHPGFPPHAAGGGRDGSPTGLLHEL